MSAYTLDQLKPLGPQAILVFWPVPD